MICIIHSLTPAPMLVHTQALPWKDHLAMLCKYADNVGILFESTLTASVVVDALDFTDEGERGHGPWLTRFLRACPPPVLRQFVARATTASTLDLPITVTTSEDARSVTFVPQNRLVILPLCGEYDELDRRLRRVLNVAEVRSNTFAFPGSHK